MSLEAPTRRRKSAPSAPTGAPPASRRTVPFDYAFRYELEGEPGKAHHRTVTVSIEAAFTAVSIGYGVIPSVQPIVFPREPERPAQPPPIPLAGVAAAARVGFLQTPVGDIFAAASQAFGEPFDPRNGRIGPRTAALFSIGFRLNPEFAENILLGGGDRLLAAQNAAPIFQAVAPPPDQICALRRRHRSRIPKRADPEHRRPRRFRWRAAISLFRAAH